MRPLLCSLAPFAVVLTLGCGGSSTPAAPTPVEDTGVDAPPEDVAPEVAPLPCVGVKCDKGLVCDKLDGQCKPPAKDWRIGGLCTTSGKDPACGVSPSAVCFASADGFPDGYCSSRPCDATHLCPVGSSCAKLGGVDAACYLNCDYDAECRDGTQYRCQDVGSLLLSGGARRVCYLPGLPCFVDTDCPLGLPKCSGASGGTAGYCK